MTAEAVVPAHLAVPIDDPSYGRKKPLFRRQSGKARITIFEGGHEVVQQAAISWLSQQVKPIEPEE